MKSNPNHNLGEPKLKRELGLAAATAIVVGNCIGSGIFTAPASMARVSNPTATMIGWIITAIGSLLIALSFANLGTKMPHTGGPIVYTKAAFGDFAAFLIAWTYWIGAWVGNAAIITAFMKYLGFFFDKFGWVSLEDQKIAAFIISSAILWIFTYINIRGIKEAGFVGIITTVLKIVPLIVFVIIAAINFDPTFLSTVNKVDPSTKEAVDLAGVSFKTIFPAIAVALWAFVGLESATVPAGEIKNPEVNIRKSTIYGTLVAAVVYLLVSFVAMGIMDQTTLAASESPLADIIGALAGGSWGAYFIAGGAVISTLGATSGWILTTARSGYAGAEMKLFPAIFGQIHKKFRTPAASLIISGVCANILLIMNYTKGLSAAFEFMILLATLAFLPAYSFAAAAEIVLLVKHKGNFNIWNFLKNSFFALLAFAYSIFAIYGTGAEVVMYGFILMLVGIPFYVYMMIQNNKNDKGVDKLRKDAGITE